MAIAKAMEVEQGHKWVVDADLRDFFGSAAHEKLLVLLNQQVADGRVLALLESIMKVGYLEDGKICQTPKVVPSRDRFMLILGRNPSTTSKRKSGGGSGRIATNGGVMLDGKGNLNPNCTVSWGLQVLSNSFLL